MVSIQDFILLENCFSYWGFSGLKGHLSDYGLHDIGDFPHHTSVLYIYMSPLKSLILYHSREGCPKDLPCNSEDSRQLSSVLLRQMQCWIALVSMLYRQLAMYTASATFPDQDQTSTGRVFPQLLLSSNRKEHRGNGAQSWFSGFSNNITSLKSLVRNLILTMHGILLFFITFIYLLFVVCISQLRFSLVSSQYCPTPHPSPPPLFPYPCFLQFLFSKGQASYRYQPAMLCQVVQKLDISLLLMLGEAIRRKTESQKHATEPRTAPVPTIRSPTRRPRYPNVSYVQRV